MPVGSYIRNGLSFARRNAGKIALFSLATGTIVAASTYFRRQARAVSAAIHAERLQGARKLRTVFLSNSLSICTAFRNLLPNLRGLVTACESVDTSQALGRLRERPADLAEKHTLWQTVKVASITHFASSIYLTALLYSFLSLQMNLLARYNMPDETLDAPVQPLPGGPLSATTSKSFLDLVLHTVLNQRSVNLVVCRIERVVQSITQDMDLTETPCMYDIENLFTCILNKSWNDAQYMPQDDEKKDEQVRSESANNVSLSAMLHGWLFDDIGKHRNEDADDLSNVNYVWLVGELLDLCEVLDFNQYVYNNMTVVCNYVMRQLRNDVDLGEVSKRPTFARLLARFSSMASMLLSPRGSLDGQSESYPMAGRDGLDRCIAEDELGAYFAASVFLSGEKDKPGSTVMHGV